MKYLKMLGLAAVSAMALMAFASTASATTLETVGGQTRNEAITITATLEPSTTLLLRDTFFVSINTCTESHVKGTTTVFTGTKVEGPTQELSFGTCTHNVTIKNKGSLYVEHEAGSTNGDVYSKEAEVESFSTALNEYINCTTGTGTVIGTITAAETDAKHATMKINASLTCDRTKAIGTVTAKWEGSYTVTTPTGLGVSA